MTMYSTPKRQPIRRSPPALRTKYRYATKGRTPVRRPITATNTTRLTYPRPFPGKVGFPAGYKTACKRMVHDLWGIDTEYSPRTLIWNELTKIPQKTTTAGENGIDYRERQLINCVGFQLRIFVKHTNVNAAVVCRMAVVSPTDKNTIGPTNFFQGYGPSRGKDFAAAPSHEFTDTPINPDTYTVLWQKKFTLAPCTDGASSIYGITDRHLPSYHKFTQWVPLKRQLRYDSEAETSCADAIYLVAWFEGEGSSSTGSDAAALSIRYKRASIAYWHNP